MPLTKVQSRGTENVGQGSSNVIINGAMNVAQRSTSETALGGNTSTYRTVDRFKILTNGTAGRFTMSQDSSAPSGFANSTKFDCTTADTSIASGEYFIFRQIIEGQNLQQFAKGTSDAKQFAVSFYVKGNASATYNCVLGDEDNTRQSVRQFTVGTDWSRVELIFPADTTGAFDDDNAGSLEFNIYLHAGSDFTSGSLNENVWEARDFTKQASGISSFFDSTDRTFFITGVQMEVGSQVSDFQHEDIGTTFLKCNRYFQKFVSGTNGYTIFLNGGIDDASGDAFLRGNLRVQMRAVPTYYATNSYLYSQPGGTISYSGTPTNRCSAGIATMGYNVGAGSQGHAIRFESDGTSGTVEYDAEL